MFFVQNKFFSVVFCSVAWLAALTGNWLQADIVRLLTEGETSLIHRLELIDSAEHEILMSAYEVGDDAVSLRILATLRRAASRGVCVKLMVDGHAKNNLMPKPLMEYLIGHGVHIREHLPDVRYKIELGRQRMHDKLLVVDEQRLIMGGRNVRADYYGMGKKNFLDREVYLAGPTAQHARTYYLARWNAATSGQPDLYRTEKKKVAERQEHANLNDMSRTVSLACVQKLLDEAAEALLPQRRNGCPNHCQQRSSEEFIEVLCPRFLHDIPEGSKRDPAAIAHQLNEMISSAQKSILIQTPYLVFTRELRQRLAEARRRGVAICIVTNSLETSDHLIVHAQYSNERRWLRNQGIQLWEIKGECHMHDKAAIVDHRWSMLGSYNFDVLSETRNSEVALLIDNCRFAEVLADQIAQRIQVAKPVPQTESLFSFDARTNAVENKVIRENRIKRMIAPWVKKYL